MQVERAREQGWLSQAFHQWQLLSLRSRLHSVSLALAAVSAVPAATPDASAAPQAQEQSPAAAVEHSAVLKAQDRLACLVVSSRQLQETPCADREQSIDAEAAAQRKGNGSREQAAGMSGEPADDAISMDVSHVGNAPAMSGSEPDWEGDGAAGSSQSCQPRAAEASSDLAHSQDACEGSAGADGPPVMGHPAAQGAESFAESSEDMLHPDDDGLHEWVSSSCSNDAQTDMSDIQASISSCEIQALLFKEPDMQATSVTSSSPAQQEPPATHRKPLAVALEPRTAASRNAPAQVAEPPSFGQKWACARGLDSPGSPGNRIMSPQQQKLVADHAESVACYGIRPAVSLSTGITAASSMTSGILATPACMLQSPGFFTEAAAVSSPCARKAADSAPADARGVNRGPWATGLEAGQLPCLQPEAQQPGGCPARVMVDDLLGSPGAPTTHIAPMVCAALGSGAGSVAAGALSSPITLLKEPLAEGAPPDGRHPAMAPAARRCHGDVRLSQISGWSSEQDSCSSGGTEDDSSRERLRKRLFRSVDCLMMACPANDGMAALGATGAHERRGNAADAALQGLLREGPGGPLQQGRMGVGRWDAESLVCRAAEQLTPAPLEAGCMGGSRVRSLTASFEAATSASIQCMSGASNLMSPFPFRLASLSSIHYIMRHVV